MNRDDDEAKDFEEEEEIQGASKGTPRVVGFQNEKRREELGTRNLACRLNGNATDSQPASQLAS